MGNEAVGSGRMGGRAAGAAGHPVIILFLAIGLGLDMPHKVMAHNGNDNVAAAPLQMLQSDL